MKLKSFIFIAFLACPLFLFGQTDTTVKVNTKSGTTNPGGIFISPTLSAVYPIGTFSNYSKIAAQYGVRLEYSSKRIYPFVVAALVEISKHGGKDEFLTANLLNSFDTKITSVGASVDIILSKYLKTNFTIPFLTLEAKYMNINRTVNPDTTKLPGIQLSESQIAYGGGIGFTLYIFDIYGVYMRSSSYSTFSLNTRFHFPLFKF